MYKSHPDEHAFSQRIRSAKTVHAGSGVTPYLIQGSTCFFSRSQMDHSIIHNIARS